MFVPWSAQLKSKRIGTFLSFHYRYIVLSQIPLKTLFLRCMILQLFCTLSWHEEEMQVGKSQGLLEKEYLKVVIPSLYYRRKNGLCWPPEANMRFLTMILGRKGVQMTLCKFPISNFTGGQHAVNRRWPKSPRSWKNAISSKSIFCWKWLKQLLNWY